MSDSFIRRERRPLIDRERYYREAMDDAGAQGPGATQLMMRELCLHDLWYMLTRVLDAEYMRFHDKAEWLYERCCDVQDHPNGHLDLWAREHFKSTIITYGLTIQDILYDPELTVGIFSLNRPIAKGFLRQIKRELEENARLRDLFTDVIWQHPQRDAPKWSEDEGIILMRQGNPKEATVEAWGLVDAMPTSRHFKIRLYDDVIDERNVTNPDMIRKSTNAWRLSLNLGSAVRTKRYDELNIERYVGTRYHFNDTYRAIISDGGAEQRLHPATDTGDTDGKPVLITPELLAKKRKSMGSYIFACQMLLNPKADEVQGFSEEWIRYWPAQHYANLNIYLLVDPAGEKKKSDDYTVMEVIGLGPDQNYYLIYGIRDRMNLRERTECLFRLHKAYNPLAVGYEKLGKDSDNEHIEYEMDRRNYRFTLTTLHQKVNKFDRIRQLIPAWESYRWFIPPFIHFVDYERKQRNFVTEFINDEFLAFPVAGHDDMLDTMAMIHHPDLRAEFPMEMPEQQTAMAVTNYDVYDYGESYRPRTAETEYDMWGNI
jgi:predicted phage terminase large subunit-like protein